MDVKISEVVQAIGARPIGRLREDLPVKRVSTDTRTIEKGDLFFALSGPHFDGHDFIGEALKKGAGHLVISDPKKAPRGRERKENFLLAEDTLKAYGDLAAYFRKKFKIPAVAVTGSSGKTTVKELVAHMTSLRFSVLKNRGTENNLVGVPKTILQLEPTHELLVLEMGTNRPGEIDRLSSIVSPQIGILTSVGASHLEGLGTVEGVRNEKLRLVHHLERGGILILNGDDPLLKETTSGVHRLVRTSCSGGPADFTADRIQSDEHGSVFRLNGNALFWTPLVGRHNISNCLLAIAAGASLGLETEEMIKTVASFKPLPGRMIRRTVGGVHFIDDTYNANPLSFHAALEAFKGLPVQGKKGVVCGDMLELGKESESLHRQIGALVAAAALDFLIATGTRSRSLADEAAGRGFDSGKIFLAKDSEEAAVLCRRIASAGDWVLVKGSRGMQMEKVIQ